MSNGSLFHKNSDYIFAIADTETTGIRTNGQDYVIELAIIFTDNHLNVLDAVDFLVALPELKQELANHEQLTCWPEHFQKAYEVHNIPMLDVLNYGYSPETIVSNIEERIDFIKHTNTKRIVLVSDNAAFETHFIKQIYHHNTSAWPFHYSTWDTNIILDSPGLDPRDCIHRALPDAMGLLDALRMYNRCCGGIHNIFKNESEWD